MRHIDDSKPTNRPAKGAIQDGPYSGFRPHLGEFFYRSEIKAVFARRLRPNRLCTAEAFYEAAATAVNQN
jgi:hypothetical protein